MDQQQFEIYIQRVADKHHISPQEVLQDVGFCIAESEQAVKTASDPNLLDQWMSISQTGDTPTAYEFISHIAQLVLQQLKDS